MVLSLLPFILCFWLFLFNIFWFTNSLFGCVYSVASMWVNLLTFSFSEFPLDFFFKHFPMLCQNFQSFFSLNVVSILKILYLRIPIPWGPISITFCFSLCVFMSLCIWFLFIISQALHLQTIEAVYDLTWHYLPPGRMYNSAKCRGH